MWYGVVLINILRCSSMTGCGVRYSVGGCDVGCDVPGCDGLCGVTGSDV